MSDEPNGGSDTEVYRGRTSSLLCALLGHKWVGHTAYKLKNDLGRAMYGDLCERCGKFQPTNDGKERYTKAGASR